MVTMADLQTSGAGKRRGNPAMVKGGPSLNPGGRSKKLSEIERMLDVEHRSVENMRWVMGRLRTLACGGYIDPSDTPPWDRGNMQANAGTYSQAAVGEPDSERAEDDRESIVETAGGDGR